MLKYINFYLIDFYNSVNSDINFIDIIKIIN